MVNCDITNKQCRINIAAALWQGILAALRHLFARQAIPTMDTGKSIGMQDAGLFGRACTNKPATGLRNKWQGETAIMLNRQGTQIQD